MYQSSKSLCPSLRGVPEDSKTPPTCQVWMILSQVIAIGRKLKFSKIGLICDFEKQCLIHFVFGCFISQISCKLCKLGVFWNPQDLLLTLDDGHWDFDNCSSNDWDNWSWNGHIQQRNHFSVILSLFKRGLQTSASIFSAIFASIFKISVPIIKRSSWGFRNTPNLQSLNEFWLRKQQKTVRPSKSNIKPIFDNLCFSLNCHKLAQNYPNLASWGCFGIVRSSSYWWAEILKIDAS